MATNVRANEIAEQLKQWDDKLKIEVRPLGKGGQVVATRKRLVLGTINLHRLAEIVKGCVVEFGRSGGNFRFIIY